MLNAAPRSLSSCSLSTCARAAAIPRLGPKNFRNLVPAAQLSFGAGVIAAAAVNPYALLGLAPVLLAIAAILRAVGGRHGEKTRGENTRAANNRGDTSRKTRTKPSRTTTTTSRRR